MLTGDHTHSRVGAGDTNSGPGASAASALSPARPSFGALSRAVFLMFAEWGTVLEKHSFLVTQGRTSLSLLVGFWFFETGFLCVALGVL